MTQTLAAADEHGTLAPPHDLAAERATLGGMLMSRTAIDECLELVAGPEFYRPAHELIFNAIATLHQGGEPADPITVTDELTRTGQLRRAGGATYLHDLVGATPVAASAGYYAQIVSERAAQRRLVNAATRIQQLAYAQTGDLTDLYQQAEHELATASAALPHNTDPIPGQTIDAFLAGDDPDYDWLIPDVLERLDRLIITAAEGVGKSTLLRQWAVQVAAGIHPFTGDRITPVRVLYVDLENSRRQSRRKMRALHLQAGPRLDPRHLVIECKVDGLDLTNATDQAWLSRMIGHHQPDLLITGPIYKLANGNPNDEVDAKPVAMFLDRMRAEHDVTVLLEAHSKKGEGGPKKRPKEPFGWSGWMRWPEFGLNLSEDGDLTHWRGARDERSFPSSLRRGGPWPWTPATTVADQNWVRIRDAIRDAGRKLSTRELEVATGMSKSVVNRIMQDHGADLAKLYFDLEMGA